MDKLVIKSSIILLLLAGSVGLSTLEVTPILPHMMRTCAVEKLQESSGADNSEQSLASVYNDCSVLPQSLAIIVAGIGLAGILFLLKSLKVIELKLIGISLVAALFIALELVFYAFFQYKYFYDSQLATTAGEIFKNYLFALSSLASLCLSVFVVPRLLKQTLFSDRI